MRDAVVGRDMLRHAGAGSAAAASSGYPSDRPASGGAGTSGAAVDTTSRGSHSRRARDGRATAGESSRKSSGRLTTDSLLRNVDQLRSIAVRQNRYHSTLDELDISPVPSMKPDERTDSTARGGNRARTPSARWVSRCHWCLPPVPCVAAAIVPISGGVVIITRSSRTCLLASHAGFCAVSAHDALVFFLLTSDR
jgi:hypothetical protein